MVRKFDRTGHLVFLLAFSPDTKLLATAEPNETARLWDMPSGALRADGNCKVKLWNIATRTGAVQNLADFPKGSSGRKSIRAAVVPYRFFPPRIFKAPASLPKNISKLVA